MKFWNRSKDVGVQRAEIASFDNGIKLKSKGFQNCNVVIMRDKVTGDSLLLHLFPPMVSTYVEDEGAKEFYAPVKSGEEEKIEGFLNDHDDVIAIGLYGLAIAYAGSGADKSVSEYFKSKFDVDLIRHNIPTISHQELGDRPSIAFDAEYDVDNDTLEIFSDKKVFSKGTQNLLLRNFSERCERYFAREDKGLSI